jgi:glycine cleavage system regulatory protein
VASSIVFTFLGADKPGLIEGLSNTVSQHGGNWLESRMSHLAGQFAGIIRVQVSQDSIKPLTDALLAMSSDDFTITVQRASEAKSQSPHRIASLSIVGNDRPGIVKEVSRALAEKQINIYKMETDVVSAAMTADPLFDAKAVIELPEGLDLSALTEQLDDISNNLGVDIILE